MPEPAANWVVLAHLLRPQGRKGELLAELETDFPDRFQPGCTVFLAAPGIAPTELAPSIISSSWLPQGRNQGRIVLGFEGIDSIEKAERLLRLDVVVPESDRIQLTDDSVYTSDLIGCVLYDNDNAIGTVTGVQFLTTADGKRRLSDSAPLLTVDVNGAEALIPFAKDLLVHLDITAKRITMHLPEGLLQLNVEPDSTRSQKRKANPSETIG